MFRYIFSISRYTSRTASKLTSASENTAMILPIFRSGFSNFLDDTERSKVLGLDRLITDRGNYRFSFCLCNFQPRFYSHVSRARRGGFVSGKWTKILSVFQRREEKTIFSTLWHFYGRRVCVWDDRGREKKKKVNEDTLVRFDREMKCRACLDLFDSIPDIWIFSQNWNLSRKKEKVRRGKNFEIILRARSPLSSLERAKFSSTGVSRV